MYLKLKIVFPIEVKEVDITQIWKAILVYVFEVKLNVHQLRHTIQWQMWGI